MQTPPKEALLARSVPGFASWTWTREFMEGIFRNIRRAPQELARDTVSYFSDLSQHEYAALHRASNDKLLSTHLSHSAVMSAYMARRNLRIYDLGAGSGEIFDSLKWDPTAHITLVDFAPAYLDHAKASLSPRFDSVTTLNADLRCWCAPSAEVDLVLCVMVLPYLTDCRRLFENAAKLLRVGGHFCLMYPLRSPVWEEEFEGIRLVFHDPRSLRMIASNNAMRIVEKIPVRFSIPGTFGLVRFTIANCDCYQKVT